MSTKRCCTCGESKSITEFSKRARSKDGLQARCRQCFKLWHQANKESHNKQIHARTRRIRAELMELIRQYLLEHPCVDCGCRDLRVLEFDHVGEKVKDISRMVRLCRTWDTIKAEIGQCEVRCANCHRLRTYERAGAARALWIDG
ncbi:MAG TPA: hypothetical protein VFH56_03870 [Acidimicrobiales bacterium]|nr:hypothetical protein [Acidimicrobiales bacterium]